MLEGTAFQPVVSGLFATAPVTGQPSALMHLHQLQNGTHQPCVKVLRIEQPSLALHQVLVNPSRHTLYHAQIGFVEELLV
jgi:hypothetical protein